MSLYNLIGHYETIMPIKHYDLEFYSFVGLPIILNFIQNCNMNIQFKYIYVRIGRKLFPVFCKARKIPGTDKKSVTLKSDVLIINGKRYTVETLNQLKCQLDMKHFIERSNNDRIVFGGMFSNFHPLSNYFACPITFRKQSFGSLEHAYQHMKTLFFGHEESVSRIKAARDPSEAKRISYEINGPRDLQKKWDNQRVDLTTALVKAKCQENPDVVKELKLTGNRVIAESGRDRLYATGRVGVKYTKYHKYIPSTSTGQVFILLKST